ncbi:MAG: hypothetical protein ACRDT8_14130 [Micromonosporaceae bacterium]
MRPEREPTQAGAAQASRRLSHVYWIGGASGGGKSTIARRLAARHEFQLYVTDAVMPDHARRSTPQEAPRLAEFIAMDMDERWVDRSPQIMLDTFHWFRGECFDMVVDELQGLRAKPGVIAEGLRLLPHLVKPLAEPGHAVWLLPSPAFRRAAVASRGGASWAFLGKTSDPDQALRNLLERDRMFTERLHHEATRLELPVVEVDTHMTEDDLLVRVTDVLDL